MQHKLLQHTMPVKFVVAYCADKLQRFVL